MIKVVGAVAVDMIAVRERFLDGTSNPSDIRFGLGGVGYRIFSNLETPKLFITALADDPISRWAREALEADGDVAIQTVSSKQARPPLYLALMESGSLKVAASDFRIVEQSLSSAFVAESIGEPHPDDFLVLDANLSAALLSRLIERYAGRTRLIFEPVSVEKAARHAEALRDIFLMTPTGEELETLCKGDVPGFMQSRRIGAILETRGREGAVLYSGGSKQELPPVTVVKADDTTGAGDLLLAQLLTLLHAGAALADAVRGAMRTVEERLQKGEL
jgi:sugar/nucleoside kinase (ribokinase family)